MAQVDELRQKYLTKIIEVTDLNQLERLRIEALGKQGEITLLLKTLGQLTADERKEQGLVLNVLRQDVATAIESQKIMLEEAAMSAQLATEFLDVTLPVRFETSGTIHPLSQAMYEACDLFQEMGFVIAEGPEIESDYYNFSALNVPAHHPARQDQDTFYFKQHWADHQRLLRTQTSPVQIRTMERCKPPIKIIAPGRVFRSDYDQTHTPVFHQIEGLYIDRTIHMGHLKGCLTEFCRRFFECPDLPLRFRPAYFPFTEPSAEVDIGCRRHNGQLTIGEGEDWLEILGSGMVHPQVLENCGIDSNEWQGFAFGVGIERIAMLKYGIYDLRGFYENDLRWLRHYGFSAFSALMKGASL